MTRTSTGRSSVAPRRRRRRSWSTRSSFTWRDKGISPISSRNRMPPPASSKRPRFMAPGPREGPLLEAEQLAFQQGFGQGAAVHGHEGPLGPVGIAVDEPGHHFLAGAAFAREQHRGVRAGDLADEGVDLPHDGAHAHQLPQVLGQWRLRLRGGQQALQHADELLVLEGLGDEVHGALVQGLDRGFRGGVGGHDHHRRLQALLLHPGEQLDAGAVLQLQIGEDTIEGGLPEGPLPLLDACGGFAPESGPFQGQRQHLPKAGFILHQQDPLGRGEGHGNLKK